MTIFVDTTGFFAYLDADDDFHADAQRRWHMELHEKTDQLVTSNYVVVETIALLQRRVGMSAVKRYVSDLLPTIKVLWVDSVVHTAAVEAMLPRGANGPSLVDLTSQVLMHLHGIHHALAYDKHFKDTALPPL